MGGGETVAGEIQRGKHTNRVGELEVPTGPGPTAEVQSKRAQGLIDAIYSPYHHRLARCRRLRARACEHGEDMHGRVMGDIVASPEASIAREKEQMRMLREREGE